jgi:hypothetical protein
LRRFVVFAIVLAIVSVAVPAQAASEAVTFTDRRATPKILTLHLGTADTLVFTNNGSRTHTVRFGAVRFSVAPGATSSPVAFLASGRVRYTVDTRPRSRGWLTVPVKTDASTKPLGQSFTLTWSLISFPGLSYDVEARYPRTDRYVFLFHATQDLSGSFLPPRKGTYRLRARSVLTGRSAKYSFPITITVT